jgi:hypothetical protein
MLAWSGGMLARAEASDGEQRRRVLAGAEASDGEQRRCACQRGG